MDLRRASRVESFHVCYLSMCVFIPECPLIRVMTVPLLLVLFDLHFLRRFLPSSGIEVGTLETAIARGIGEDRGTVRGTVRGTGPRIGRGTVPGSATGGIGETAEIVGIAEIGEGIAAGTGTGVLTFDCVILYMSASESDIAVLATP